MSVEATGWAFRQKIPPKPKMVLMALADQTDERTGRVCYGKTSAAHLAEKSCVPVRTLHRYINAFVRNGYMRRDSGKGKGSTNSYWLCLDRPMAESLDEWKWWVDPSDERETQDIDGCAVVADPTDDTETEGEGVPLGGRPGVPLVADQESAEEPKNVSGRAIEGRQSGFSRQAQDAEIEDAAIQRAAAAANARFFVIENSRAWKEWCEWRGRRGLIPSLPTCAGQGEYVGKRGWWMPSLFPPAESTGPPTQPGMTEEDVTIPEDFK